MELSEENAVMKKVEHLNEKDEHIIYVTVHRSKHFVITCKQAINHQGILTNFELRGYLLESQADTNAFGHHNIDLYCEVIYASDLHYLKSIHIQEFLADNSIRNMGYGSIMMQQLIQYAARLNAEYICGGLSYVDVGKDLDDVENRERRMQLHHFYKKHGFKIDESNRIILYI